MFLYKISFQNPATPLAEGIIDLHHSIFFYLILILIPVLWMFYTIIMNSSHEWAYPTKKNLSTFRRNYLFYNRYLKTYVKNIVNIFTNNLIQLLFFY